MAITAPVPLVSVSEKSDFVRTLEKVLLLLHVRLHRSCGLFRLQLHGEQKPDSPSHTKAVDSLAARDCVFRLAPVLHFAIGPRAGTECEVAPEHRLVRRRAWNWHVRLGHVDHRDDGSILPASTASHRRKPGHRPGVGHHLFRSLLRVGDRMA